ncbi:HIT family protein [Candidatus Poribacteria bacterium]|nr:HIT family protein [Candidatus Poribacteria bacterium]
MDIDKPCIFCQIVRGEKPASIIYQDDLIMAFMLIRPIHPGEFMIIPKEHIDEFCDIPDDLACHIIIHAQRLSRNLRKKLNPKRVGLVVHGFGVAHAHLIVVPQHDEMDIVSGRHLYLEDGEIKFGVSHLPSPSREELNRMAECLSEE